MQWELILATALVVPIIFFPVALVWFVNLGGIHHAIQTARREISRRAEMANGSAH